MANTRGSSPATDVNLTNSLPSPHEDPDQRQLLHDADEFVTKYNLDHARDMIRKGALLASNPLDFDRVEGLTESELSALSNETKEEHKFHHIKPGISAIVAIFYSFIVGWMLFLLYFPGHYGIAPYKLTRWSSYRFYTPESSAAVMWLNCVPYIGATVGSLFTESFNRRLSRRGAICASTAITIFALVAELECSTLKPLLVVRILLGFAAGVQLCSVTMYTMEMRKALGRRSIVILLPMITDLGFATAVTASLLRQMSFFLFNFLRHLHPIISIAFLFCVWIYPDSPHWYVANNQIDKAYESLRFIRSQDILAARDLCQIYTGLNMGWKQSGDRNILYRGVQLLTLPRLRRATVSSVIVAISGSLTGTSATFAFLNIILVYAFKIINDQPGTSSIPWSSLAMALCTSWMALCITFYIGRRRLLLILIASFAILIPAAGSYTVGESWMWAVIVPFCGCIVPYWAVSVAFIPLSYAAEAFPTYHRGLGMALSAMFFRVCQALVSVTVSKRPRFITSTDYFNVVGTIAAVFWVLIFVFCTDTTGHTVENIHHELDVSLGKGVWYKLRHIRYFVNRVILRKRDPLVTWEESRGEANREGYTDEDAISLAA